MREPDVDSSWLGVGAYSQGRPPREMIRYPSIAMYGSGVGDVSYGHRPVRLAIPPRVPTPSCRVGRQVGYERRIRGSLSRIGS